MLKRYVILQKLFMRHLFFVLTALTFLSISCKKDDPTTIVSGTYKGTFKRSFINNISNVTIKFSSGKFEGESQYTHYPDICNGNFSVSADTISFQNACVYTADFDWSYILSGKFVISVFGDSLIIKRGYNGVFYYYDSYKLKKQ